MWIKRPPMFIEMARLGKCRTDLAWPVATGSFNEEIHKLYTFEV
jgi:hypothetical protein